jgi:site-specific DNA-cytosine methylase
MSRAKKSGNVSENESITGFLNAITAFKPKYWLMENLPGLLKTYSDEFFKEHYPDYHIIIHEASVSHWGNSQLSRKRLVIIGVSKSLDKRNLKYFKLPELDYSKLKFSQEFEMGNNEELSKAHIREPLGKMCNLYYGAARQITYRDAQSIWNSEFKDQGRWHVGGKMNNQPGVSRNLPYTFPLTVRKQNRQFGTKGLVLSPREMANIQGVPESFNLHFEGKDIIYWINKARLTVTKTMPHDIAKWFAKQVLRATERDYRDFSV